MGGDGAVSLNRRSDVERRAAEAGRTVDAREVAAQKRRAKWKYCALSRELLWPPIVADRQGALYKKDAVVQLLLDRRQQALQDGCLPAAAEAGLCPHIRKMRDVRPLTFMTRAPKLLPLSTKKCVVDSAVAEPVSDPVGEGDLDDFIVCPVTDLVGGAGSATQPFVFFWECGHVVSQAGIDSFPHPAEATTSQEGEPSNKKMRGENGAARVACGSGVEVAEGSPLPVVCPWPGCTSGRTIVLINPDAVEVNNKVQLGGKRPRN